MPRTAVKKVNKTATPPAPPVVVAVAPPTRPNPEIFATFLKGLPTDVREAVLAEASIEVNVEVTDALGFSIPQMVASTRLLNDVLMKIVPVENLVAEAQTRLTLTPDQAKEYAKQMLGKRLLIIDSYFSGKVSETLTQLGVNPQEFAVFVAQYREKLAAEKQAAEAAVLLTAEEQRVGEATAGEPADEEVVPELSPEQQMAEFKSIIGGSLMPLLSLKDLTYRKAINDVLLRYLVEFPNLAADLINALVNNPEPLTAERIVVKNETVEPTIQQWLADFIVSVRTDESLRLSTMQKARYYNENQNFKKLTPTERELVQKVFDIYENLVNFPTNIQRMPLDEIRIFTFTEDEQLTLNKMLEDRQAEETAAAPDQDLNALYRGDVTEAAAVEAEMQALRDRTKDDLPQLNESFYQALLGRKKIDVIASLRVLTQLGALDDVVSSEKRFQELLIGYFKRNNLAEEIDKYRLRPSDPKYVKHFLKYVLMERLGMRENEAARIGVHLGNIFRSQGNAPLAQLAYFDLEQKKFHWL